MIMHWSRCFSPSCLATLPDTFPDARLRPVFRFRLVTAAVTKFRILGQARLRSKWGNTRDDADEVGCTQVLQI